MRKTFSSFVELGRELTGPYATGPGMRHGRFFLARPPAKVPLTIIISDGSRWHETFGVASRPWEHVSVSAQGRCPTWEEMCWVKDLFFDPEELVLQFHPPRSVYVNNHPHCLHLWRPLGVEIPLPPPAAV